VNTRHFLLSIKLGRETSTFVVLMTMGVGYCIVILTMSSTVRGFYILPMEIYWLFPVVTVICFIMLLVALPYATFIYKYSYSLKLKWKLRMNELKLRKKYYRKQLRALWTVCFYFGSYRELNDESKTVYIESIIERFMNGILVLEAA